MEKVIRKIGKENQIKYKNSVGLLIYKIVIFVFLTIFSISLIFPIAWALVMAGKDVIEYTVNPFGWPTSYTFSNFSSVLEKLKVRVLTSEGIVQYGMDFMLYNTLLLSIFPGILVVFFTACMAYVLGVYKFIGSTFLHNLGIVIMILPIVGTLPSTMMVFKDLGIYDNMLLYILKAPVGCFSGMNYLILRGVFQKIPAAYREAAEIDGAGHYTIFFKIMMPTALPTCFVFFLLTFLGGFGDYSSSLYWLPSRPTLSYGMYMFKQQAVVYEATVPEILCGYLILMVPNMIMYFIFHNLIISRMQVGGLKE